LGKAKRVLGRTFLTMSAYIKKIREARCQWLMPVILATHEAEIRVIVV
jgi:hypothetical protein